MQTFSLLSPDYMRFFCGSREENENKVAEILMNVVEYQFISISATLLSDVLYYKC